MPASPHNTLFERLCQANLLSETQIEELSALPETTNPDSGSLEHLLRCRGLLTAYQLKRLNRGKGAELTVGPYLILDRLGGGGMGEVFKARHRHMNRIVALKLIRKDRLGNDVVQRFEQEVHVAAHLQHPNIVLAYDAGLVGETHFFAMEFVEGVDLARLVQEKGPLLPGLAAECIRQAALGLQHVHEKGMVHRDIKPHNLLLATGTGNPLVKILDLGLARLQRQQDFALTQSGQMLGTPAFLAPEQAINSRTADIRSDLYSLGGTLHFLLSGRPPFEAETLTQLLLMHQMSEPTPLDGVPGPLQAIVNKLMQKKPDDRYQSPAELAEVLAPLVGCKGVPLSSPKRAPAQSDSSVTPHMEDECHRKSPRPEKSRLFFAGIVGLAVLLLGMVVKAVFLRRDPEPVLPPEGNPQPPASLTDAIPVRPPMPVQVAPATRALAQPTESSLPRPPGALVRRFEGKILAPTRQLELLRTTIPEFDLSSDGKLLAVALQHQLTLYDAVTLHELRRLVLSNEYFNSLEFSPAGDRLVGRTHDKVVHVWDVPHLKEIRRFESPEFHSGRPVFSPDGRFLAMDVAGVSRNGKKTAGSLFLLDVGTGKIRWTSESHGSGVVEPTFTPDGTQIVTVDENRVFRFWSTATGSPISAIRSPPGMTSCVGPGAERLVTSRLGCTTVWSTARREVIVSIAHDDYARQKRFCGPDRLVICMDTETPSFVNGRLKSQLHRLSIWELPEGRESLRLEATGAFLPRVRVSKDGRRVATFMQPTLYLWDLP
jgi:serine/threonine protein kinase